MFDEKGDTIICFTRPKTQYFLKTIYKVQELSSIVDNQRRQLTFKDTVIHAQKLIIKDYEKILLNKNDEMALMKYEITKLNECLDSSHKAYRRQKLYKIGAFTLSGGLAITSLYLLLLR